METRTIALLALAGMVALAGCSGGPGNGTATPGEDGGDTLDASSTGTVNFYVSDQPGALEDFRTLNVTITRVGFKPAATDGSNESNASNWQEYDINDTTVDLTQLVGPNATLLDSMDVPNGSYEKVVAYTGEVNGTLTDGTSQTVRVPSEKLQMNNNFTVEANESVDFVFDIQVTRAGNSGRYNIRPVISQSGTDKEIETVDARANNRATSGGMRDGSDDGSDQSSEMTQTTAANQSGETNESSSAGNQTAAS